MESETIDTNFYLEITDISSDPRNNTKQWELFIEDLRNTAISDGGLAAYVISNGELGNEKEKNRSSLKFKEIYGKYF